MPVKIYEDSASFTTKQVVPVPIGDDIPACYPQVRLEITPETVEQTIPILWMENEFIRLGIAPSLGGRIVAITDLRTGLDVISFPTEINLVQDDFRGARWNHGIEFLAGKNRTNSLGPVDFRVKEAGSPEDKGAVFLFEWTGDVSWHAAVTLFLDRAAFLIEQNLFNRRWLSVPGRGGIDFPELIQDYVSPDSCLIAQPSASGGLFMSWTPGDLTLTDEGLVTGEPKIALGGHRTDSIRIECSVFSSEAPVVACTHAAAVFLDDAQLTIQPHQEIANAKVFLSVSGQTLEAPLSAILGGVSTTSLNSLPGKIDAISIRGEHRETLVSWPSSSQYHPQTTTGSTASMFDKIIDSAESPFRAYLRNPGLEPFCYWMEAVEAIKSDDFLGAEESMDKYLGFNAEDALGWWFKASIRRESGKSKDEDARELPNAHYLAPLEPILRAEAFLNTPIAEGKEPNPLLAPLAANPEHAVGVVGMYLECHLIQGMARLADELLRHRDNAMVRYLLAYALLEFARNETAASEQVMLASKLPIEPPFPNRLVELTTINQLAKKFTNDQRLKTLKAVMGLAVRNLD
ncbi:MAG: DUF5107 domain-containing protein [Fimbriimonadaceae bacterium]|nr:MAG: DUF5107 domain-containing protein [Fimbriimonadaceae bacterium]